MQKNTQTPVKSKTKKPLIDSTHTESNPLLEQILFLENRIQVLSDICSELNPYEEISAEQKMKLMNFNILDFSDPFKITNQLLVLLEDSIDELHLLRPLSDDEKNKEVL